MAQIEHTKIVLYAVFVAFPIYHFSDALNFGSDSHETVGTTNPLGVLF